MSYTSDESSLQRRESSSWLVQEMKRVLDIVEGEISPVNFVKIAINELRRNRGALNAPRGYLFA